MANSIITVTARESMVKARCGLLTMPTIIGMAFGEGGVDASGVPIPPNLDASALKKELFRKTIDGYEEITKTCYRYRCTLLKAELVGKTISEVGLYDSNEDLVSIKTFNKKIKDDDMEMIFEIDDQF